MANNQFLDATVYANVFLLLLKNQLVGGRLVDGQFRDEVTDENGLSVNIKRPPQFVANSGEALSLQPVVTGSTNVKVDQYKNVHVDIGDLETVQSYNELMANETMQSAASELAHEIDRSVLNAMLEFHSEVGVPGNVINTPQDFNAVHTRLMEQSVPNSNLNAVVQFADGEKIRGSLLSGDINQINRNALERTRIPILSEIDLFASQNIPFLTAGTREQDTGPAVAGADQNVDYINVKDTNQQTIDLDGFTNGSTFKKGEIFTISGVKAVNNRNRQPLPYDQQFTILEDATADGTGAVTLTISPAIIVGGTDDGNGTTTNTAFQTVDSVPANDAAVTFAQAPGAIAPVRAAFHQRAISLVSARLPMPFTGEASFTQDPETGIGIRYWRGSDISTGRHVHRWDVIYGVQNVQRTLGARVNGPST